MWNKTTIWACFYPSLRIFQTNTVHPQPVKRNAYMIAESSAASVDLNNPTTDSSQCPCSWGVLRGKRCAVTGTLECESRKCVPVHEHRKLFTLTSLSYALHVLISVRICVLIPAELLSAPYHITSCWENTMALFSGIIRLLSPSTGDRVMGFLKYTTNSFAFYVIEAEHFSFNILLPELLKSYQIRVISLFFSRCMS